MVYSSDLLESGETLFEREDVSALDVTVIDPGSSVAVQDKTNQVEYLG
jgi:hypothetical protein